MPRDTGLDPPLCTNGDCDRVQARDCTNLFCPACCSEKCDGTCDRAVCERVGTHRPEF